MTTGSLHQNLLPRSPPRAPISIFKTSIPFLANGHYSYHHFISPWVGFGQTTRRPHAPRHMQCLEAMRNLLYVYNLQR